MREFGKDRLEYRHFLGDGEEHGYAAAYEVYRLSGVFIREVFGVDPGQTEEGVTTVYFFPGQSHCFDSDGTETELPRIGGGDVCVLRAGEADERCLRVAEAGYFLTRRGVGHIRLRLR